MEPSSCQSKCAVSPISFGIELPGGIMQPIIRKGTPLPAIKNYTVTTSTDDQPIAHIKIYAGERILTQDNILMLEGKLEVEPAPSGVPSLEIEMEINLNSTLLVKVSSPLSGKHISLGLFHMDFPSLGREAEGMSKFVPADRKERERVKYLHKFKDFAQQIRHVFGHELAHLHEKDPELSRILSYANETLEWLGLNLRQPKSALESKQRAFEDVVCPKLEKLLEGNLINEFGDALHDNTNNNSDIDSQRTTEDEEEEDDDDDGGSFVPRSEPASDN